MALWFGFGVLRLVPTILVRVFFRLQERPTRLIAGVNKITSFKNYFKSFPILTLPSIYMI